MSYIQNGSGGGGSGTVTSVGLGADSGAILVVSGSPVTTSGTLQLQFNTEPANTVFAGPTTGANATPTFRALVFADLPAIPSGTILWNQIGNASGNLTLANAGNTTTFNQTSAVAWLWANTTTGTAITTNASPLLELSAQYYTGSTTGTDLWTIGSSLAAGTNGASTLKVSHTGAADGLGTFIGIQVGGTTSSSVSIGEDNGVAQIWMGVAPTQNNALIAGSSTDSYFNTPSGGTGHLRVNNTDVLSFTSTAITALQPINVTTLHATNVEGPANTFGVFQFQASNQFTSYSTTAPTLTIAPLTASTGNLINYLVSFSGAITGGVDPAGNIFFGNKDTGISRLGAASLAIGNGTAGNTAGTLALSRLNGYNADMSGSVSSAPTGVVATNVVVAVGAATATFTVSSTEGFTIGDTVTLSASGWTGGSGLASTTATVTTVTSTTSMILTRVSGGPWVAGTYAAQTGTLTETGGTSVSVIYATAYTSTPIVVVTPTSNAGAFYISASSTTGFTVTYASSGTQTFNYYVIGNPT